MTKVAEIGVRVEFTGCGLHAAFETFVCEDFVKAFGDLETANKGHLAEMVGCFDCAGFVVAADGSVFVDDRSSFC